MFIQKIKFSSIHGLKILNIYSQCLKEIQILLRNATVNQLKEFEIEANKRDDQGDFCWELRECSYISEFEN